MVIIARHKMDFQQLTGEDVRIQMEMDTQTLMMIGLPQTVRILPFMMTLNGLIPMEMAMEIICKEMIQTPVLWK